MRSNQCPGINLFPFCQMDWKRGCLYIAENCLGCAFAAQVGVGVDDSFNGSKLAGRCNEEVDTFPLPLANCSFCNMTLLNGCLLFLFLVTICTVTFNLWSVAAWLHVKSKRPQIYIKLSLTVSDLLFGVLVLPEAVYNMVNTMYAGHEEFYHFWKLMNRTIDPKTFNEGWVKNFSPSHISYSSSILYITQGASLCSLLLLSIDRHLAITRNILYPEIVTKKRCVAVLAVTWLCVTLFSLTATATIGQYLEVTVSPSLLFLPVPEPVDMQLYVNMILMYLIPLLFVFIANVIVTLKTSCALRRNSFRNIQKVPVLKTRKLILVASSFFNGKTRSSTQAENSVVITNATLSISLSENESTTTGNAMEMVELPREDRGDLTTQEQKKSSVSSETSVVSTEGSSCCCWAAKPRKLQAHFSQIEQHARANTTLLLILFAYSLCVLPLAILMTYSLFEEDLDSLAGSDGLYLLEQRYIGNIVAVSIFVTSSLWNCVIYSMRNRDYRRSSRLLLKKLLKRKSCSQSC